MKTPFNVVVIALTILAWVAIIGGGYGMYLMWTGFYDAGIHHFVKEH